MSHPNTAAVGLSGGAATLIVYLSNKYVGTHLTTVDGAGIATGLAAVVVWVGRRGIKAALLSIWRGSEKPAAPTLSPPPPPTPPTAA